jgi:hypothetical protein
MRGKQKNKKTRKRKSIEVVDKLTKEEEMKERERKKEEQKESKKRKEHQEMMMLWTFLCAKTRKMRFYTK